MKSIIIKNVLMVLVALFSLHVSAQLPFNYNGLKYEIKNGREAALVSGNGIARVTIAASVEYNGKQYPVTSIKGKAFENSDVISVIIPNSVKSIGEQAFWCCENLTYVSIPNSVTSIGGAAFHGCSSLTSVTIPNSVTSIGSSAFYECTSLTSITIPESVTSIGDCVFTGCSALESIDIPNSVTSIGQYAFSRCKNLTSVNIPNSVKSIGDEAFKECQRLKSVNIPDGVTSIGYGVFYFCQCLSSIEIPNSVTSIGAYAFYKCFHLASVNIPNSVKSIGKYAFYNCIDLTSVSIPNSVTSIGDWAFANCPHLASLEMSNGVTSIGASAFKFCYVLTSVSIPNSVTSIGENAFYQCMTLTSVSIPNSVTSIGNGAFYECNRLKSVTLDNNWIVSACSIANIFDSRVEEYIIGNNVISIRTSAFKYFHRLKSVTISEGVLWIDECAFSECDSLTSVSIPNSVTSIGASAFQYCYRLTSVNIPNSVTSIGEKAFSSCSDLTSVTIGNCVTSIGDDAFYGCKSLKSVVSKIEKPFAIVYPHRIEVRFNVYSTLKRSVFSGINKECVLTVPKGTKDAYIAAAGWTKDELSEQIFKGGIIEAEPEPEPDSRSPFDGEITLPGTLEAENYDIGGEGVAYHDNEPENLGDGNYRQNEGVDIVAGSGGKVVGWTNEGEWTEYTVNVINAGKYTYEATVSSGVGNGGFSINVVGEGGSITKLADVDVSQTSSWDTYQTVMGDLLQELAPGTQIIRIILTKGNCNIDKVKFDLKEEDPADLSKDMYHVWDGCTATSKVTDEDGGGAYNVGKALGSGNMVYGDGSVYYTHYANLTGYNTLLITGTPGMELRVLMNRLEVGNGGGDDNGGAWTELNPVIGTDGTAVVDLSGYEFVHLNAIKLGWESPEGIIESLKVSKEIFEQPVTVTANNLTMVYGDNVPALTYKSEGAELNGTPKLSTTATKASAVGTYPIKVEAGTVKNTKATYVDGTFTITKAPLTVGVQDVTITEGDAIPTFTLTYSGWKNSDTEATAFTTKPTAKTTATATSKAGTYDITVSGGTAKNYELSYTKGKLTILKKDGSAPTDLADLSKDMYHVWDGCTATSKVTDEDGGGAYNVGEALGSGNMVYGDGSVYYTHYANLTGFNTLLITGTPGTELRVLMNRLEVGNGGGNDNGGAWTELNPVIGTDGTAVVDLSGYEFVHLNAIKLGWESPEGIIESLKVSKEILEQPKLAGDANGDGTVNVFDVTAMVNDILGSPNDDYVFEAADVNGDGIVNVFDVTKVVNIILGVDDGSAKTRKAEGQSGADKLYIEDFEIEPGEEKEVNILLDNPDAEYRDLQFDLYLPEGITVVQDEDEEFMVDTGSRCTKKHTIGFSYTDGHYVCMLYSTAKNPLSGNSGDILTITLKADGNVAPGAKTGSFRNVSLSKTDATGPTYDEFFFELKVKGEVDAIVDVDADSVPSIKKIFRNGEIIIIRDGKEYDTNGKPAQ